MDATDIQILAYITKNPNATLKEIAEEIRQNGKKLHPSTIFRRVNRLTNKYSLKPFFHIENEVIPYYLGLEVASDQIKEFLKTFQNCPRVIEIHRVTGTFNILMKMVFENIRGITLCVDKHIRINPSVKSLHLCAPSMPLKPKEIYLPEIILQNPKEAAKITPCGVQCSKCLDYEINCLGCPTTQWYKQSSFPLSNT